MKIMKLLAKSRDCKAIFLVQVCSQRINHMSLSIAIDEPRPNTKRIQLDGSLDTNTASDLDRELDVIVAADPEAVILDLDRLNYISSAGLRVIFKLRKAMKSREGEVYATNLQPQKIDPIFSRLSSTRPKNDLNLISLHSIYESGHTNSPPQFLKEPPPHFLIF